jgi:hypothetical protein
VRRGTATRGCQDPTAGTRSDQHLDSHSRAEEDTAARGNGSSVRAIAPAPWTRKLGGPWWIPGNHRQAILTSCQEPSLPTRARATSGPFERPLRSRPSQCTAAPKSAFALVYLDPPLQLDNRTH